ncbi:MAG: Methicillin resistance protein [Parcubacteria group bacterium GW2011_GWA2_39_18]|nr:MAG: Methicillin resistance protein [Parcubacteria group bacterium GW2011_GWA2_39_18]
MDKDSLKKNETNIEEWVEKSASFLQSHDWTLFQESLGRRSLHFDFFMEKNSLPDDKMVANFYFYKLPLFGGYWYCPRGPIGNTEALEIFLKDFSNFSKNFSSSNPKPFFVRVEFCHLHTEELVSKIKNLGFEKSPHTMQPEKTSILDLTSPEEDLLKVMQSKTRYNIKIAKKNNVEVRELDSIEPFLELLHETSSRNKFRLHPDTYYGRLFTFFSDPEKSIKTKIFGAFLGNTLLAADMVIFYGKRTTYLHGASSSDHRNLMAPYLLHWEIMKNAKKSGFSEYDLWGIDEKKWPGVTRFKESFGGKEIEYIGSYDFPINNFGYKIYKIFSRLNLQLKKWLKFI